LIRFEHKYEQNERTNKLSKFFKKHSLSSAGTKRNRKPEHWYQNETLMENGTGKEEEADQ